MSAIKALNVPPMHRYWRRCLVQGPTQLSFQRRLVFCQHLAPSHWSHSVRWPTVQFFPFLSAIQRVAQFSVDPNSTRCSADWIVASMHSQSILWRHERIVLPLYLSTFSDHRERSMPFSLVQLNWPRLVLDEIFFGIYYSYLVASREAFIVLVSSIKRIFCVVPHCIWPYSLWNPLQHFDTCANLVSRQYTPASESHHSNDKKTEWCKM